MSRKITLQLITYLFFGLIGIQAQTIKDIEGNIYKTIKIGDQIWMAENLKSTKFNDGTTIPLINDTKAWEALLTPAYCWYNNDIASKSMGALYNWYTANTKNICPKDWHVPNDEDWISLFNRLGENPGAQLKSSSGWFENGNGTNKSGFNGLPTGFRMNNGLYYNLGRDGDWWSSNEELGKGKCRGVVYSHSLFFNNMDSKKFGYSIRCIKD